MTLEQLKDIIILVAAGISAIGIPTLIGLIWKFHETQVKALQMFTFKEVEQQISAMENTYIRVNKRLREYVEELERQKEKQKYDEPQKDIESRLELLRNAKKELSNMPFVLDDDLEGSEWLRQIFGLTNRKAMQTVQTLLDNLIKYEENVMKNINSGEAQALSKQKE